MKSMMMITMDYHRALAQANALDRTADRLQRIGQNKLESSKSMMALSWKGENGDMARMKVDSLQKKVMVSSRNLKTTAETIRKVAKNIYEAERRTWEIAQNRTY